MLEAVANASCIAQNGGSKAFAGRFSGVGSLRSAILDDDAVSLFWRMSGAT
jgi:hypothetical protein